MSQPSRALNKLWPIGLILLGALLAGAVYSLRPLLNPPVVASAPVNTECDLHRSPCSSVLPGGGRISLSVEPREIRPMTPLDLDVQVDGIAAHAVTIDFVGVNMDMGLNRSRLRATGPGRYQGSGMLPVCVRSRMVWDAKVRAETAGGLVEAAFRFQTVRP